MTMMDLITVLKELGLAAGVLALCFYIARFVLIKMSSSLDKLVSRVESFTDRVRLEHENHSKEHDMMMKQHEGIMDTLGRINGYKEK